MPRPGVFIAYSHRDEPTLKDLLPYLAKLERESRITVWNDQQIKGGERWHEEIEAALDGASIAVVLISQQFLASDFVHHEELPRILLRQLEGRMSVLPVFISPSTVRSDFIEISDHEGRKRRIVLAEFQGFGTPDYPLSDLPLPERQHRFVALAHRIHELSGDGEPIHGPHRIATRPSVTHERDLESKLPALSNAGSAVIDIAGFWDLREWPIPPRSSSVQALNVSRGYLALVRSDLWDRWAGVMELAHTPREFWLDSGSSRHAGGEPPFVGYYEVEFWRGNGSIVGSSRMIDKRYFDEDAEGKNPWRTPARGTVHKGEFWDCFVSRFDGAHILEGSFETTRKTGAVRVRFDCHRAWTDISREQRAAIPFKKCTLSWVRAFGKSR